MIYGYIFSVGGAYTVKSRDIVCSLMKSKLLSKFKRNTKQRGKYTIIGTQVLQFKHATRYACLDLFYIELGMHGTQLCPLWMVHRHTG